MRAIALSKKPRAYIPKEFRDEANPPKFMLRSITRREMLQIQASNPIKPRITDDLSKLQSVLAGFEGKKPEEIDAKTISALESFDVAPIVQLSLDTLTIHIEVLKLCLTGWENVPVSDTETLPFDKNSVECLDTEIITELANEVMGTVTEEEAENLEEVSASQSGPEMKSGVAETA